MLKEKIDTLYRLLGCNNSTIARVLDCSPSDISRIHSGSRSYKPTSRPVLKFAEGIFMYACNTNALKPLSDLCGADSTSRERLIPSLIVWLFDTDDVGTPDFVTFIEKQLKTHEDNKLMSFGERLNSVIGLLGLTNTTLAKKINLDASAVSRFRNGIRIPKEPINRHLADTLFEYAERKSLLNELSRLCDIKKGHIDIQTFCKWLYAGASVNVYDMDALLDTIDALSTKKQPEFPDLRQIATDEILRSHKKEYMGVNGLRDAVIRFLGSAIEKGGELYLYSSQSIDWMVGDAGYQAKWTALMFSCIQAHVHIRIIHNIDRSVQEMISAIQSWLPLYASGMIEPYVCTLGKDNRFARTIFLNEGMECVSGSVFNGNEENAWYEYITNPCRLDAMRSEFNCLLQNSIPLIRVKFEDYESLKNRMSSDPSHRFVTLPDAPFSQLKIIITKNEVAIARSEEPYATFIFSEPRLVSTFTEFFSQF